MDTETPLVDEAAFSTGNAFIVLHKEAQKIERQLRRETQEAITRLRALHEAVTACPIAFTGESHSLDVEREKLKTRDFLAALTTL